MRWTGFFIGAMAGAAAAAYLSKTRPGMVAWAGAATGELLSNMRGRTFNALVDRKFGQDTVASASKAAAGAGSHEAAWNQIETAMNTDPAAKREVQDIMAESTH